MMYKETEDTMSKIIWTKGIKKSSNCGGRDHYASSPPGTPQTQTPQAQVQKTSRTTQGGSGQSGNKRTRNGGKGGGQPNAANQRPGRQYPCRAFNISGGCPHQSCKYQHACNTYLNGGKMYLQTNHNADNHV